MSNVRHSTISCLIIGSSSLKIKKKKLFLQLYDLLLTLRVVISKYDVGSRLEFGSHPLTVNQVVGFLILPVTGDWSSNKVNVMLRCLYLLSWRLAYSKNFINSWVGTYWDTFIISLRVSIETLQYFCVWRSRSQYACQSLLEGIPYTHNCCSTFNSSFVVGIIAAHTVTLVLHLQSIRKCWVKLMNK